MVKIALDAGHGIETPGKRTPTGEREWTFNDKVVRAAIAKLNEYENVLILRVDDPTGVTDISLQTRTDRANMWKADVYISCHHNANTGNWGSWTGVETYTLDHPHANPKSLDIAKIIHPLVVKAMGLKDRGLKKQNFHVLRKTKMPAILVEGGFMDSRIDIVKMRQDSYLKAQGEALAEALITHYNLVPKTTQTGTFRVYTGTFPNARSLANGIEAARKDFSWTIYEKADSHYFNPTYRIFTGTFSNLEAAEDAKIRLQKKYGWVTYIRKEY